MKSKILTTPNNENHPIVQTGRPAKERQPLEGFAGTGKNIGAMKWLRPRVLTCAEAVPLEQGGVNGIGEERERERLMLHPFITPTDDNEDEDDDGPMTTALRSPSPFS